MRTFVDTNILVYAVDEADARRRSIARDVLAVGAPSGARSRSAPAMERRSPAPSSRRPT